MAGFKGWEQLLLRAIRAPVTPQNIRALDAWQRAEGGAAADNPLNTTQQEPGAGSYNGVGVRNYGSAAQGVAATAQTLENGRYGAVVNDLRHSANPAVTARDVGASPWGTSGSLIAKVLGSTPLPTGNAAALPTVPRTATVGHATSPATTAAAPAGLSRQIVSALLGQIGQKNPDYSALFPLIGAEHSTVPAPTSLPPQPGMSAIPQPAGGPGAALTGQTNGLNTTFEHELSAAARAAGATKVRVDSGVRSPSHNAAVGGVPHSNHITGDAADGAAYVPGRGWVPLGVLLQSVAAKYGLRSGNVPGFYRGGRDPGHVDDGANMRGPK